MKFLNFFFVVVVIRSINVSKSENLLVREAVGK